MPPGTHCYFDHYQSDPANEPVAIGGLTTLEKAYSYEPIPAELSPEEAKYILGAQANIWTEYMPSSAQVEYMAYPRVCALSEVVWTAKEKKNWPDFSTRIKAHFARLDAMGVNYAKGYYDVSASFSNGKISLSSADANVTIRYTLDGKEPSPNSPAYQTPFAIQKNTVLKFAAFDRAKPLGKVRAIEYLVHKASGKPYTLSRKPEQYTGGEAYALTNGVQGAQKTWSSWVGLVNRDIDPVIDFGKKTSFSKVKLNYLSAKPSWIYPPRAVAVYGSADGENFKLLAQKDIPQKDGMEPPMVENVILNVPVAAYRYLKCVVKTFGVIPKDMPGADNGAWLFVDEIVVE
jgi:hexosaminidase